MVAIPLITPSFPSQVSCNTVNPKSNKQGASVTVICPEPLQLSPSVSEMV